MFLIFFYKKNILFKYKVLFNFIKYLYFYNCSCNLLNDYNYYFYNIYQVEIGQLLEINLINTPLEFYSRWLVCKNIIYNLLILISFVIPVFRKLYICIIGFFMMFLYVAYICTIRCSIFILYYHISASMILKHNVCTLTKS